MLLYMELTLLQSSPVASRSIAPPGPQTPSQELRKHKPAALPRMQLPPRVLCTRTNPAPNPPRAGAYQHSAALPSASRAARAQPPGGMRASPRDSDPPRLAPTGPSHARPR